MPTHTGFSSVGRAFDCSGLLISNCHLFDSGNSEKALVV